MIKLIFMKVLMLTTQVHQKIVIIVAIAFFINSLSYSRMSAECHDVLIMYLNFKIVAFVNIDNVDYCCIVNGNSTCEVENLLQNANLNKKVAHYKNQFFFVVCKRRTKKL